VRIHTFLDRTSLVDTTLDTVSHTLLMGMALVVIVLILFLGNWRGALLVSITIPASLLIAFILMHLTDIPANLLSLGAIDFGIIVDGAIVMLETILKKREDYPEQYIEEKSIAQRAKEVGRPILFSTIVIITAYLPLFAFERVERKLFTPMAFTMSYAMIGALSVALLLIPGLAYAIYRKPRKVYKNKWLEKLKEKYTGAIVKLIEKPIKTILFSCLILIAGIVLSGVVGKDFLPELDEGSIWLQVNLPPGISVEKSREMSDTLRSRTMKYPEVTYIMVQAGRNDDGTDPFTPSHFEVSIGIKPYDEWPNGKTKQDLIHELEEIAEEKNIETISAVAPQRATVIQLVEGESNEMITHIIPPEGVPEMVTAVPEEKSEQKLKTVWNHAYIDLKPSGTAITSMDEKLINHAVKYVEDNIARSDLSVEELSKELGMSRVHLYKKLLAITGKTPIEFIRIIRLQRAAQLLRGSQQNISEIAYQVGFNNPKYFSRYFKEEFGILPSAFQYRQGR
jgi:cobalt-zinc-cadmium resistance protein CzcA